MDRESDGSTNCGRCTWNSPQNIDKGTGELENNWKIRQHPDQGINKIGQNTEKSPGNFREKP